MLGFPELSTYPVPQVTVERNAELDKLVPTLRSAMFAAIPDRINHMVCPGSEEPTPIDLIIGVQANIKNKISSQVLQWRTKAESLQFEHSKGLKGLLSENGDLLAKIRAAQFPQIDIPDSYISFPKESVLTCPLLEQCSLNWYQNHYVDFEDFKSSIRSLYKTLRKTESNAHTFNSSMPF